jgi:TRAP-type C4-dicarboxylate transport system substrate-binding protein
LGRYGAGRGSKPVRTLEDLKGMKIRGTGRNGESVTALGATVVPIEMMDMYESLRRRIIDGNMGPFEVDSWMSYIQERITYWKGQEKARNIPTAYKY